MSLIEICGASVLVGFGISFIFLAGSIWSDGRHGINKVLSGSLVGALLIAATCFFCLVAVIGLSMLAGVSLTAFSVMSFTLSVGFAVEYSVHIVARWLRSDRETALERVDETMSFLMLPTFMSFVSSVVGVLCLSFTGFEFNTRFFFTPLIIVMFVTYFFGIFWLPVFLTWFEFDFVKLGPKEATGRKSSKKGHVLSKLQESESSEIEDTSACLKSKSTDLEMNNNSTPAMVDYNCARISVEDVGDTDALDFLSCYNMSNCGADDQKTLQRYSKAAEGDDNSLIVEKAELTPSQTETSYLSKRVPLFALQSALSSASSQRTAQINNTRKAYEEKNGLLRGAHDCGASSQRGHPRCGITTRSLLVGDIVDRSLVDAASTESLGTASSDDIVLSKSSNVFDGVDTVVSSRASSDEHRKAAAKARRFQVGPPGSSQQYKSSHAPLSQLGTSPLSTSHVYEGPRSTGNSLTTTGAKTFFADDPPIRRTLSSPRKRKHEMNPRASLKHANVFSVAGTGPSKSCSSTILSGENDDDIESSTSQISLLNTEDTTESRSHGYDMESILDKPLASAPVCIAAQDEEKLVPPSKSEVESFLEETFKMSQH